MTKLFNYGCVAIASTLSVGNAIAQPQKNVDKERPNLFLFIADDWSAPHAGVYGDKTVKTPAVDYVAQNGVMFTNAFCAAPTSTSSRAAVLTGRYSHALKAAGNLWSMFPKDIPTYASTLSENGYEVGYTKKGWGPGVYEEGAWADNPAGHYSDNFKKFVQNAQAENKPFCFWYGSKYPHRPYEKGKGEENGIDPTKVEIPDYLPDNMETRIDISDYYYAVERMDYELHEALRILKESGELSNTLIIITSDNGMPFPRAKASLYDSGTSMPFIAMWADKIEPGRVSKELISLTDIAPTFLEAAGIDIPQNVHGKSLLPYLLHNTPLNREFINGGRERHGYLARPNHGSYPVRSLRSGDYLLIRNIRPDRYPGGDPVNPYKEQGGYSDVDGSPTKTYMIDHKDDPDMKPFFDRTFAKRPEYELYDIKKDPSQFTNLATDKKYAKIFNQLKKKLEKWMLNSDDPRAVSDTDIWDTYPYYGKGGADNESKAAIKKAKRENKANKKRRNLKIQQESYE